ncbi:hypothetical protein ABL78_7220 [Leptomonas seymouri]|uniref:Uncharacterized protein n=1 Tax=Leptomonas seymouri TaxID=5684 RepID=A0A0N1PBI9_LEPSE|nr:hypothetical protein ABL78_7220 [Leptomonas seymouri]|eukprot:KPI83733.1 hypothetical protein ABL78_7220 [Leptomonas seymouri]
MSSSIPHNDPRLTPVVRQLATVAARVHAVWERMGVPPEDCSRRWQDFLHASLLPFVADFCKLQESAEYNAATENDVLLRDVCYLATRLEETPRHADVAVIVSLLRRHYTRTPMQSPLLLGSAGSSEEHLRPSAHCESGDGDAQPTATATRRSTKELMLLSLPSFTELLKQQLTENEVESGSKKEAQTAAPRAASTDKANSVGSNDDGAEQQQKGATAASETNAACDAEKEAGGDSMLENEEVTRPPHLSSAADARRALQHMMETSTHEGVRQQLQTELDSLTALADSRLRVLQLLCKQRAILSLSAVEQEALRAAYCEKYCEIEAQGSCVGELDKRSTTPLSGPATAVAAVTEPSISPPASSHFQSPPPSPKSSRNSSAASASSRSPAKITNGQQQHACRATAVAHGTTTLRPTTQAELQLLLSADSCAFDLSSSWGNAEQQQQQQKAQRSTAHTSDEESLHNESTTTWPICSSTTATATSQRRSTQVVTALPSAAPQQPQLPLLNGRPTIFQMDVSSVTAYGTHQDLSLHRIQQEAESILSSIADHNRRLQEETKEELQALETLEVLWRAVSAQVIVSKASPVDDKQEGDVEEERNPASRETHSDVAAKSKASRALATAVAPPLAPLQPTPFAESREQVMARYAQLQEAFAADVAAQQAAPSCSSTIAMNLATSTTSVPPEAGASSSSSSSSSPSAPKQTNTRIANATVPLRDDQVSGGFCLPPIVRQVLLAPSFAPVFNYVHHARVAYQKHLSAQQDAQVEEIMARLRTVYEAYYAATQDSAYAVAPDGELRVAMEEELLETLQASELEQRLSSSSLASEQTNACEASKFSDGGSAASPPSSSGRLLLSFQRHLTACQQVREQAADEIEFLRLRLDIIQQAEPLVLEYQSILLEDAEMQASSRERLLSKKVNMAKQLLQEEKVRRRVAKDLPRIIAHLTELVAAWDALQAADLHGDGHIGGVNGESHQHSSNKTGTASPKCSELCIRGQRVRNLLVRAPSRTATASSCARPRSISAHAAPTSRSVSPAPPPTSRTRTEPSYWSAARPHSSAVGQRSASPAYTQQQQPQRTPRRQATPSQLPSPSRKGGVSLSPSSTPNAAAAAAAAKRTAPPSLSTSSISPVHVYSQPTTAHQRYSPKPPLVPSGGVGLRVRSLSPLPRQGLSARAANTPVVSHAKKSQSPAPRPGAPAARPAPFSTNFKSHH